MEVRFSELAIAGLGQLFEEESRRISIQKHIALSLRIDATLNAIRFEATGLSDFWLRPFFAGFDVRVLFEVKTEVTVWSISRASPR